jgi:hypothetical protein
MVSRRVSQKEKQRRHCQPQNRIESNQTKQKEKKLRISRQYCIQRILEEKKKGSKDRRTQKTTRP